MKKRTWIYIALIVLCVAVFFGYRVLEGTAKDNTAPKITLEEGSLTLSVNDGDEVLLKGVSAIDARDGDVSSSIIIESVQLTGEGGKAKVNYAAFDKAGNVAKISRDIEYIDYVGPQFTLNSSLTFSQNSNFDVLSIVKAKDFYDGDISHRIRATTLDSSSISAVGVHDVEFRVTNSLGDTTTLVLPVEVYSQGSYNANLSLKKYLVYMNTGDQFDAESYLSKFTVNGESRDLSNYLPTGYSLRTQGFVDTNTPGVYSVNFYVTNERGTGSYSTAYKGIAKLIVIVEE